MRLKLLAAVVLLALTLSGCGVNREADRQYTVSALGFDCAQGRLLCSAEVLVVNSESSDREIATEVFTAAGSTPAECVYDLGTLLAKRLLLSHCGIIAVGDSIGAADLKQIIDYCVDEEQISLSAYLVSTPDAAALLSGKTEAALTIGYELMGFLDRAAEDTGVMYGSRIYEIAGARLKKTAVYLMPRFTVSDEQRRLEGTCVYLDDKRTLEMDTADTVVYSLVRNMNRGGRVAAEGYIYNVEKPHTYFETEIKGGGIRVSLDIRLGDRSGDRYLARWIIKRAEYLKKCSGGADIFGLADRIYAENGEVWREIKQNPELLAAADTKITCEMGNSKNGS